jgi:hypothetical protein
MCAAEVHHSLGREKGKWRSGGDLEPEMQMNQAGASQKLQLLLKYRRTDYSSSKVQRQTRVWTEKARAVSTDPVLEKRQDQMEKWETWRN